MFALIKPLFLWNFIKVFNGFNAISIFTHLIAGNNFQTQIKCFLYFFLL